MASAIPWTRERVLALPADGKRYELIDGNLLVSPAARPQHQVACFELALLIDPYVRAHALGMLLPLAADLAPEPGQLVQPDLFVLPPGPAFNEWDAAPLPILVAEVLSPSTARHDRGPKRALYQRAGISEYWVIDVDACLVERWRPGDSRPEVATTTLTWHPRGDLPPLHVDLAEFFRKARREA